ncbi:FKBP-type peptidyl-prolyl cis-trans isomerase [Streptomyces sp. PTM05]|uniref:peptidylprolyl isomerase n=1 Tax=Streptantibioticus parmotrematis TaxID=2873249 RepID=A0ABS7QMN2_9ACTN|nr:FKBP-type peptidyl-prolyl cis-trans isomerase [Streptantibioticus parmotrematis]MBY8884410.1 FKBP-type peptidyl-prolyl cis-trans isomerase [Streptantibioticus parmotrematis]
MTRTTFVRRAAAMLVAPALLLTAAACGSNSSSGSSGAVAQVTGKEGSKPAITIPKKGDPSKSTVVKTLDAGSGTTIKKGDWVRADVQAENWKNGQPIVSSWTTTSSANSPHQQLVLQTGQASQQLPEKVLDAVVGQKTGSRVLVQGTAGDLVGSGLNPQSGISASDTLVWVVDVAAAGSFDAKAEAKGTQAPSQSGLPTVQSPSQKPAVITIPKGEKAPSQLKQQVLIQGTGPVVKKGQGLIAQYTGVMWSNGKKFDSSWDHGGATGFQIGTGSVVPGWDKALVGKHVGDRVLVVIPPADGYGSQGNPQAGISGTETLVFSVDILGTV